MKKLSDYEINKQKGATISRHRFCKSCRDRARYEITWKCLNPPCDKMFSSNSSRLTKVYCSNKCNRKYLWVNGGSDKWKKKYREENPIREVICPNCSKLFNGNRRYCSPSCRIKCSNNRREIRRKNKLYIPQSILVKI